MYCYSHPAMTIRLYKLNICYFYYVQLCTPRWIFFYLSSLYMWIFIYLHEIYLSFYLFCLFVALVLPGPCDPECSDDGCEGPGPQHCVTCLHFFLKFKNNTRLVGEQMGGRRGGKGRGEMCRGGGWGQPIPTSYEAHGARMRRAVQWSHITRELPYST